MYSQLKVLWHQDRIKDLAETGKCKPVHVHLILSDLCNQDCYFCAYRMSNGLSSELFVTKETHNPNRKIPTEKALEIIADCRQLGVKAIQFTGGGEPTVHKDHLQIFEKAQSLNIETALVTNGIKLSNADPFLNMQWIRVSIDAGTQKTYTAIRKVADSHWKKVWANVKRLAKDYKGVLGLGFVVTPRNYKEIPSFCKRAKESGASNVRIGAVFSQDGMKFYENIHPIVESIKKAKDRYEDENFQVIDLFGRRLGDLESGSPTHPFCGYQHVTLYIGADLNVYRCCNTAYTHKGKLGSLKNKSLMRAWPRFSYQGFDATGCQYCQFIGHNKAIQAMIEKPTHEGFV